MERRGARRRPSTRIRPSTVPRINFVPGPIRSNDTSPVYDERHALFAAGVLIVTTLVAMLGSYASSHKNSTSRDMFDRLNPQNPIGLRR